MKNIYAKKPKQIASAQDLLDFFQLTLGHLGAAYRGGADCFVWPCISVSQYEVVHANNGDANMSNRRVGVKARVIKFLKAKLKEAR